MKRWYSLIPFFFLPVLVSAQGTKPQIIGQDALSINEDQAITILLTNLRVIDWDNPLYPWGFTLTVYSGSNYTVSNHTVTPALNFNGTLTVQVSVNDGRHESNKYDLKITVYPVNDPPVITGQSNLQTIESTPITIQLSHLTVSDPDNTYPTGFSLSLASGNNYSVNGNSVIPSPGFTGNLKVSVAVNDGLSGSAPYSLNITVISGNKRPVITGQVSLSTPKNKPITIGLGHLTVNDPDNKYPDDFSLTVHPGNNYTVSGRQVTPATNFTGALTVKVTVNDGNSNSEIFNLRVDVADELTITGQVPLQINEDETITLKLSDVTVYDPNNTFPNGFTLSLSAGDHYTFTGLNIVPELNFTGVLTASVRVRSALLESKPYSLTITVVPVNDAPEIVTFPQEALKYSIGNGPLNTFEEIEVNDVDDNELIFAEVGFRPEAYQSGSEELNFENTSNIHGVFDNTQGILSLIGNASLEEYQEALRSVQYNYTNLESAIPETKILYVKVSDGKLVSEIKELQIVMDDIIELDIPSIFSPNNDTSNDTWKIRPLRTSDRYNNAIVRVYTKRGMLIYESRGFENEWDGRYNGEALPADTYFYTIDLNFSYSTKNFTGVVNIVR